MVLTIVPFRAFAGNAAALEVAANNDGTVTITPHKDVDVKSMDITYTPEGKTDPVKVTATKDPETGKWSVPEGSDVTVDPDTGVIIVPADKVADGTEVSAKAKTPGNVETKINAPETPITVDNAKALTPEDKDEVKKAVEDANKDADGKSTLPDGATIDVADDGTATVKDKDGNVIGTIPADKTVKAALKAPEKPVEVADPSKLTDEEKGNKEKHETAIHKLYIYGYKDNTFRPEGNMTRAEAAAMIARLKGLDMSNNAKPNFSDVKSAWYNSSINAVVNAGYMKGYPDGSFAPNGKITRAEFAQMIMAIDKANGAAVPFADVKGHWAEAAIAQAYGNGRIAGYPDSTFRPNNNITRAEAVTVLNKLFDRSVDYKGSADVRADFVPFVDVTANHWAYFQIIEASNTHEFYRTEQGKVGETWDKLLQTWKQALENR